MAQIQNGEDRVNILVYRCVLYREGTITVLENTRKTEILADLEINDVLFGSRTSDFSCSVAGLGEFKLRDLNDEINKLLREKRHWEERIVELGGPNYRVSYIPAYFFHFCN